MDNEKIKLVIELDKQVYDKAVEYSELNGGNTLFNSIFKAVAQGKPYESKYVMKKGEE